jgi:hypothetical protein
VIYFKKTAIVLKNESTWKYKETGIPPNKIEAFSRELLQ